MDEVPDIKDNELLDIYTRLPLIDQPRESKIFSILGEDWNFYFILSEEYIYEAYLQVKNKKTESQTFEIDFEIGFKDEEESFAWGTQKITNQSDRNLLWSIDESELDVPFNYDSGNILLLKLRLQLQVQPVLIYKSKLVDKAEQTSPYMDVSFMLESTSKDFLKLYQEGVGHDVQLICGGQTIKAHKVVLCSRSAFFASKFEDVDTREVKVQNMDPTIFEPFFRYLYTGVLPELTSEIAIRLYEAAVEYSVDALRKQCANFLIENFSHDNAIEILKVSDRHMDSEFKKYVMKYMTQENTSLVGEKWADFCKKNPVLANEVLNFYVQQPQPKKPRIY